MTSITAIDAVLPQTQCGECGFSGCLPYAKALANGEASIDKCPPGGVVTLTALGALLHIDPQPYISAMKKRTRAPSVAVIREEECIGCTKCIQACPVDAIIGSAKRMHSVLSHECTGCGLCVEPCPVDCIDMHSIPESLYSPEKARQHAYAKQERQTQEAQDALKKHPVHHNIQETLARIKAKKAP